jgi:hypothetical protein
MQFKKTHINIFRSVYNKVHILRCNNVHVGYNL